MTNQSPISKTIPANIVGSSKFGIYPKISNEKTYNMIISDNFLIPYPGYIIAKKISNVGIARGFYSSTNLDIMIAVIDNSIFKIDNSLNVSKVASIETYSGNVYIDENNAGQIAICDLENIYIYNFSNNSVTKANIDFLPGYVSFQNTRFISVNSTKSEWRLSDTNNGVSWPVINTGLFQTKPDIPLAAIRVPGKGNMLFVMGSTVTEFWSATPTLFPYTRSSFNNIDYGCLNPSTIASNGNIIIWLGANEKSSPSIMVSSGADVSRISTDGVDGLFNNLKNPMNSYGFFFRENGHELYQLTFPDDNLSIVYDFNTKSFFHVSDEDLNYHIAKKVVYFNNNYYFISSVDGNIYHLSNQYTTYNGKTIPRIRTTNPIRLPDSSRFIINNVNYVVENGETHGIQAIDYSVSKDGGVTFGNENRKLLNMSGNRRARVNFWNYGAANDFTLQYKFWGQGRFVVGDGEINYYK